MKHKFGEKKISILGKNFFLPYSIEATKQTNFNRTTSFYIGFYHWHKNSQDLFAGDAFTTFTLGRLQIKVLW